MPGNSTETRADRTRSAAIDAFVAKKVRRDAPGLALAVIMDGEVVHRAGYGLARLKPKARVTPDTLFHMASAAKQLTGLGIVMLQEEGQLRFDDHIGRHIRELKGFPPGVTLRRLLHHAAGVHEFTNSPYSVERLLKLSSRPTNEDLIRLYADLGWPMNRRSPPGTYSDAGYDLLGCVIERASGETYRDFFRKRVFKPLGMKSTFSLPDDKRLAGPLCALTYQKQSGALVAREPGPLDGICGSGSIYASVSDLSRYDAALDANRLVSAGGMRIMLRPGLRPAGAKASYGFGWEVSATVARHSGSWNGFTSHIRRYRKRPLSIYVLANTEKPDPAAIAEAVAEIAQKY
jgi:CubicO group peptidase (beta-lactamase class C family)